MSMQTLSVSIRPTHREDVEAPTEDYAYQEGQIIKELQLVVVHRECIAGVKFYSLRRQFGATAPYLYWTESMLVEQIAAPVKQA